MCKTRDRPLAYLCLASASCFSPSSEQRTLTDSPEDASRTTARSERSATLGSSAITCTSKATKVISAVKRAGTSPCHRPSTRCALANLLSEQLHLLSLSLQN
jgi:hypothetical protein